MINPNKINHTDQEKRSQQVKTLEMLLYPVYSETFYKMIIFLNIKIIKYLKF